MIRNDSLYYWLPLTSIYPLLVRKQVNANYRCEIDMFLKGILSKILSLMVLFNLALWAFIFFSDDASIREINAKRNQLFERSNLFVKMVEPIFEATDLSPFTRQLAIEKMFGDPRIVGTKNLIITEFLAKPSLVK